LAELRAIAINRRPYAQKQDKDLADTLRERLEMISSSKASPSSTPEILHAKLLNIPIRHPA
jgi:hypothetical protein